jgi:hypothetical protein
VLKYDSLLLHQIRNDETTIIVDLQQKRTLCKRRRFNLISEVINSDSESNNSENEFECDYEFGYESASDSTSDFGCSVVDSIRMFERREKMQKVQLEALERRQAIQASEACCCAIS